jgi:hypothetical protein
MVLVTLVVEMQENVVQSPFFSFELLEQQTHGVLAFDYYLLLEWIRNLFCL